MASDRGVGQNNGAARLAIQTEAKEEIGKIRCDLVVHGSMSKFRRMLNTILTALLLIVTGTGVFHLFIRIGQRAPRMPERPPSHRTARH